MDKSKLVRCNVRILSSTPVPLVENDAVLLFIGTKKHTEELGVDKKFSKTYTIDVDINNMTDNIAAMLLLLALDTFKSDRQLVISSYNEAASTMLITIIANLFGINAPTATAFEMLPDNLIESCCNAAMSTNLWENIDDI